MRRVAAVVLLIAAAAAFAVVVLGAGDDGGGHYKVRAIFDNAGFVIPGEDVKVAGVKVGAIDSIDVTDDLKAAVVLDITDQGYQDFREDAGCIVRPQSLIGERFVECDADAGPPRRRRSRRRRCEQIEDGPGEGQYLLPVERNAKAVDLDLINNIMRVPVRQRLSIILSDLGIGVAGRGADLDEVIRRADPALKEIDEVLKILADQNKVLADLAVNSDTILAPLARERRHVERRDRQRRRGGAGDGRAARATSRPNIERLPPFLRELQPTMVRLGALSDEMTPVLDRPRRGGAGHQPDGARSSGRSRRPRSRPRVARRGGGDRHAGGPGGAAGDARPAPARGRARRPVGAIAAASCSSRSRAPTASSARWTTSSTKWPRSTGSTRSATTCAPG